MIASRRLAVRALLVLCASGLALPGPSVAEVFAYETVSPSMWPSSVSIAFDDGFGVAMSFIRREQGVGFDVCFGRRTEGSWVIDVVQDDQTSSHSLAFDPEGNPCIAFLRAPQTVKYARLSEGTWTIETVEIMQGWLDSATNFSLAIDSSGSPHLAYFIYAIDARGQETRAPIGPLRYATRSASGWTFADVDTDSDAGSTLSLALDSDNRPGIVYFNYPDYWMARWTGSEWVTELIADLPVGGGSSSCSLEFDSQGHPHVALFQRSYDLEQLLYGAKHSATWIFDTVDPTPLSGSDNSLELDSLGNPWISYRQGGSGQSRVKLARRINSEWIVGEVTPLGTLASVPSFALDSSDRPWIGYYDQTHAEVRVATWDESVVSAPVGVRSGFVLGTPFPNPARGSVALSIQSDREEVVRTVLLDVSGRIVAQEGPRTILPGSEILRLDAPFAASGIYFLRVESPGRWSESRPVVLLR